MAENILDYIVTDLYYQMVFRAYGGAMRFPVSDNTRLGRNDYDPQIVEEVTAGGDAADLPDMIYMKNFTHQIDDQGQFHTSLPDESSMHIGSMNLFWTDSDMRATRDVGPCTIRARGISKWHANGLLHRDGRDAITCKSVRFEWVKDTVFHREDGPEMVELHEVQMTCDKGAIKTVGLRRINYRWTIEGVALDRKDIELVLKKNNFGINILSLDNVFRSESEAFHFYNELITVEEGHG